MFAKKRRGFQWNFWLKSAASEKYHSKNQKQCGKRGCRHEGDSRGEINRSIPRGKLEI